MIDILLADALYVVLLIGLSFPLGIYINNVMTGQRVIFTPAIRPVEKTIYRIMNIREDDDMSPKIYTVSLLSFSLVGLVFVFLLQLLQAFLPFNPQGLPGVKWDLAFNTAASFVSNTNWQAYSGESTLTYLTQSVGLVVQNFVSAAAGIAVLYVLIRGFIQKNRTGIGNFWVDLTRSTLYILLPMAIIMAIFLVAQGVVQSLKPYESATTLQNSLSQTIPLGPAASQIAIKQLGTNGGGFFGANSAFPLENPTALSNFVQLLAILLIPAALCVAFGKAVNKFRQGLAIYTVMMVLFIACMVGVAASEYYSAGFTLEGKETIHGIGTSSLWATATTAASNGSVNAMHDSFSPLAGGILLFLMQIGEVVFGGVGSGLYGMLAFAILTVFIAGLMVGRTPEYLGKKIEAFDMKMVCLIILIPPLLTLFGTAAAVLMPDAASWLTNSGAHGFSEVLYAFTSMGNNNGSAFGGFIANTVFTNTTGGVIMLAARFVPIAATIYLAGSLSRKKIVAASEGTLSTSNMVFIGLLISIILIIGFLTFLPVLALGPVADYFTTLH